MVAALEGNPPPLFTNVSHARIINEAITGLVSVQEPEPFSSGNKGTEAVALSINHLMTLLLQLENFRMLSWLLSGFSCSLTFWFPSSHTQESFLWF